MVNNYEIKQLQSLSDMLDKQITILQQQKTQVDKRLSLKKLLRRMKEYDSNRNDKK